ncbi:MAG: endonuclease/exonuclease/phosphatase family protein [Deltaproteobacteria bacterium]|nr:endonuclease/exonuclease/phosphatase family protein [Deltaproteobacteria bacterium]MBW1815752.1 endonuclease/exonuclease/phosphatase family protein [Deltaproteobacteria bacterium]
MKLTANCALRGLLIVLVVLAISCRGKGATKIAEFPSRDQTLPAGITVVNWNAQKGKHPQFVKDLTLLLEQEKPDIVFLQEAEPDLFKPEQLGGYFAEGWHYPWPGGETVGVLTLSRVTPVRIQPVPSKYREFGVTAPKVSLVTEYPLPNGRRLLAVNVHLLNFERWSVKKIAHQLEDLKSIMAAHSGPILMVGDFNTWNQKRLSLVKEITRNIHLKEVTDFPKGRRTGDLKSDFWSEFLGVDRDLPLDRVFFSGFKPIAARILNFYSSDHAPILVRLELQP